MEKDQTESDDHPDHYGCIKMIIDERYTTFVNSFLPQKSAFLEKLEESAKQDNVPIIRREMQGLLSVILASKRPAKILEIGTAVGFSALFMEEVSCVPVQITTIENYEKRIVEAKKNFRAAGKEDVIRFLAGDAQEILPTLNETYDLIFMDAAKGQYLHFLDDTIRLLADNGMIISDNIFQDGELIESRFAVKRRDRTIHKRMREYLYQITHDEELVTTILTVGDGVAISVKRG